MKVKTAELCVISLQQELSVDRLWSNNAPVTDSKLTQVLKNVHMYIQEITVHVFTLSHQFALYLCQFDYDFRPHQLNSMVCITSFWKGSFDEEQLAQDLIR